MTGTCIALAAPLQAMQPRPCPSVTGAPESIPLVPSSPGAAAPPTRQLAAGKAGPGAPRGNVRARRRAGSEEEGRTPPEPQSRGCGAHRGPRPPPGPCTPGIRRPTCPAPHGAQAAAPPPRPSDPRRHEEPRGCLAREDPAARNVASGVAAPHPDPGPPEPPAPPGRPAPPPRPRSPRPHLVPAPPGCGPAAPGSRTRRPPPAAAASSVPPQPPAPPSPPPSSRRPDALSAPAPLATPLLGAYRKRRRPRPEAPPPLQPVVALQASADLRALRQPSAKAPASLPKCHSFTRTVVTGARWVLRAS